MHQSQSAFWKDTHRFFLYPLQPSIVLVLGSIASIPLWLKDLQGVPYWILLSCTVLIFSLFLFRLLESGMQGRFQAPQLSVQLEHGYFTYLIQQCLFVSLFIWLQFYADALFSRTFSIFVTVILTFCLPAMLITFVSHRSLLQALNPLRITECILKLNLDYFILLLLIYLMEAGVLICHELFQSYFSPILTLHLSTYLTVFISFVAFFLIGFTVYHRENKLQPSADTSSPPSQPPDQLAALSESRQLIARNQWDEAKLLLNTALKMEPLSLALHDQYHKLTLLMEDHHEIEKHGNLYLRFLITQEHYHKAHDIYKSIQRVYPEFKIYDIDVILKLSVVLYESKEWILFDRLLDGTHHRFTHHPMLPRLYGFYAKVLYEELNQDEKAKKILEYILQHYPKHPLKSAIEHKLTHIKASKRL